MRQSRRNFIRSSSAALILAHIGGKAGASPESRASFRRDDDAGTRELAMRALDSAKSAGASYADVRLTLTRAEEIGAFGIGQWNMSQDDEQGLVGVRALTDGAWGFASGPVWSLDEAARLGREAAIQAKTNARGKRKKIELGQSPPAVNGEWSAPVGRDPFTVPLSEKLEVVWSLGETIARMDSAAQLGTYISLLHRRQEKTFASTDGSFVTQIFYFSHPACQVFAQDAAGRTQSRTFDRLLPGAQGWEKFLDATLARDFPLAAEEAIEKLEAEFVQPDRYDVVFDALATAQILAATVGIAAELDRVYGYEANAGGTSYLSPPEEMLGKFALAPSLLNVTANRSTPGLPATVKWDDEGVVPESYAVIRDGVLANYHTNRELAFLAGGHSHGCAGSEDAAQITTIQPPNIEMTPAAQDKSLADMIAGLDRGLVVIGGAPSQGINGGVTLDRQQLNGEMTGTTVYMVRKGKRVSYIKNAEFLFRAPDLWKNLKAIGGKSSMVYSASSVMKGQPSQRLNFGIGAVPTLFANVGVADIARRI